MSRRITAFAMAVLFVCATLGGVAAAQSVEEQIKKLEKDRAAAVVKGDMVTLEKHTSDDYTLINMNGIMSDKAQMLAGFKSGQNKMSVDEVSDMRVRVYGDTAVVTGKLEAKGIMGGKDVTGQAMFTRVYVKKNGEWKSVALQQTRVSAP